MKKDNVLVFINISWFTDSGSFSYFKKGEIVRIGFIDYLGYDDGIEVINMSFKENIWKIIKKKLLNRK